LATAAAPGPWALPPGTAMTPLPGRGLYAITDATLCARLGLEPAVAAALRGGAGMIQYRDKGRDRGRREAEARALLGLCRRHRAPLIVNDDIDLARAVGADGVHVGRDDASVGAARAALGPGAIVGASCYNRLERARAAVEAGADYVAFGRFFPSATKPQAVPADRALVRRARLELEVPIVAIGGITPENGRALVAAGVDWLAVVGGVFAAPDPESAARAYATLFS